MGTVPFLVTLTLHDDLSCAVSDSLTRKEVRVQALAWAVCFLLGFSPWPQGYFVGDSSIVFVYLSKR